VPEIAQSPEKSVIFVCPSDKSARSFEIQKHVLANYIAIFIFDTLKAYGRTDLSQYPLIDPQTNPKGLPKSTNGSTMFLLLFMPSGNITDSQFSEYGSFPTNSYG
jgi:hypothetical protein